MCLEGEEWELVLVCGCIAVVGGGVVGVGPTRAAASPVYLKEVLKGWLVELVIDQTAVTAVVEDPLRWDFYLAWDLVQ